jgi:hypothetical protein
MAINLSIINKTSVNLFVACVIPHRFLSLLTKSNSGGSGTTGGDVSRSKQPEMSARQFTQLPAGDPCLLSQQRYENGYSCHSKPS